MMTTPGTSGSPFGAGVGPARIRPPADLEAGMALAMLGQPFVGGLPAPPLPLRRPDMPQADVPTVVDIPYPYCCQRHRVRLPEREVDSTDRCRGDADLALAAKAQTESHPPPVPTQSPPPDVSTPSRLVPQAQRRQRVQPVRYRPPRR